MENTEQVRQKKILIFSLVYYPRHIGGAEVAIKEITDRLPEYHFDMVTLRLDETLPKFERIGNVNIYRLGYAGAQKESSDSLSGILHLNKYFMLITGFLKAVSLHKQNHYDAIWSMMATYNSFAALFFKLFYRKVPFVLTLQEGDPIHYIKKRALPLYPLFKMIFTRADFIQTISSYLADFGRSMGATCPIEVIPNAVDFAHFSKRYPDTELFGLKEELGKKYTDKYIITTSRLVVKNAVGDIIRALPMLPAEVKLIILGTGYQENELKVLAGDLGVADRVRFLGYVPHSIMPKYLSVSDIFIRPSLSEGFGNSFIEAMATKIPVIATPVGGIVDFLKDRQTGLFCKVNDPESIAEAVSLILKNEGLRQVMVENAYNMVKERYDWNIIAQEMRSKVFEKAINRLK